MLPKVDTYSETQIVDLFGDSGVQFLDLAVTLALTREPAVQFALLSNGMLARLCEDRTGTLCFEPKAGKKEAGRPAPGLDDVSMKESLKLLEGLWLPVPFFRYLSS